MRHSILGALKHAPDGGESQAKAPYAFTAFSQKAGKRPGFDPFTTLFLQVSFDFRAHVPL